MYIFPDAQGSAQSAGVCVGWGEVYLFYDETEPNLLLTHTRDMHSSPTRQAAHRAGARVRGGQKDEGCMHIVCAAE